MQRTLFQGMVWKIFVHFTMLGMASFWYLPIVKMPTIPHFGWLMATHTLGKYFQISLKIMLILLHLDKGNGQRKWITDCSCLEGWKCGGQRHKEWCWAKVSKLLYHIEWWIFILIEISLTQAHDRWEKIHLCCLAQGESNNGHGDISGRIFIWHDFVKRVRPVKTVYHWHTLAVNSAAFSVKVCSF